jgi:methylamine dehydrogenase accessory protein MauD
MQWIALFGRLLLAVVLLVAAAGKLTDRQGFRRAVTDFGVPKALAASVALVLPLAELAIAALLVPSATVRWGALAALALLGLFTLGIVVNLTRGRRPECHCFGRFHSAPVGWSTVSRNAGLAAVAVVVLGWGGSGPGSATLAAGTDASVATWITLAVALVALSLAAVEAWLLFNMLRQHGRVLMRLEKVERALNLGPGTGLPVGEEAPEFELPSLTGERLSLADLRASGRPVLLFFTNPHCAPCDAVLPDVAWWQREYADRITIAVISDGPLEINRAKATQHGVGTVLLQRDREVKEAYDVTGTPAAVLVDADGMIASPLAGGGEAVEELLRQALAAGADDLRGIGADNGNGYHAPAGAPAPSPPAMAIGQPAPALTLPDLEGSTVALADLAGTSTVLLFWNPTCGFCRQMLPDLKKWERERPAGAPELLFVASGTAEANRAMRLASRIVLDADGSAFRAFGARGTPTAVLLGGDGRIASSLVVGAQAVMALARARRKEPLGR